MENSTLIGLLQRLYDPTEGSILVDGCNLKEFDLKWLHSKIGVISQDPGLFSGTFEENITYGLNMYSDDDLTKAIDGSYMKKYVYDKNHFPDGLQSNIGERGDKLSGGQKQRVAIARALIKKPDLLILDEATSALDVESEHEIMKGIEKLLKNRSQTVIVIAHRLTTIKHCDRIVVMEDGKIVEEGDHNSLIEKEKGVYKGLVQRHSLENKKVSENKAISN